MEVNISGIKCDHCHFADMTTKFEDYPKFINKPCPLCGHNLLTESDYKKCITIINNVNNINKILNVLKYFNPLYYWRLLFGDNRKIYTYTRKF